MIFAKRCRIKNVNILPSEFMKWSELIYYFLQEYTKTCPESHRKNYQTENWREEESSFLKCTFHKHRYDSGCITLTLDNEKITALSACYKFNNSIAYLSSRACVSPGYEKFHLISSFHIPLQQEYFKKSLPFGIISFNADAYSQRVMNSLKNRKKWSEQKAMRLSGKEYFPFSFLSDRTYMIHGTPQYVAHCQFQERTFHDEFLSENFLLEPHAN